MLAPRRMKLLFTPCINSLSGNITFNKPSKYKAMWVQDLYAYTTKFNNSFQVHTLNDTTL